MHAKCLIYQKNGFCKLYIRDIVSIIRLIEQKNVFININIYKTNTQYTIITHGWKKKDYNTKYQMIKIKDDTTYNGVIFHQSLKMKETQCLPPI